MTTKKRNSLMMFGIGLLAAGMMFLASPMTAYASQPFNQAAWASSSQSERPAPPIARSQPAPEQQRFNWSYGFESGMDYRFDLGRPTTFYGVVPQDVFTANVRRDANTSHRPPGPRTGNTIAPTDPSNWAFARQQNQLHQNGFWNPVEHQNVNAMPKFDTQRQGINASPQGNQMGIQTNVQTNGASKGSNNGFLPPTSITID